MASNTIKFGTDGWRAIIAEDFTFANVRICAQAVADYLHDTGLAKQGIVIGFDTRFSSADFASASAEVLAGNNIKVYLSDSAVPTPVISHAIVHLKASGGIVITASHNPGSWNGLKYKSPDGASAPTKTVAQIEERITKVETQNIPSIKLNDAIRQGLVTISDLKPGYRQQINRLIDLDTIRNAGFKVSVDSMHGAGSGYFKMLLTEGATSISEIKDTENPAFPGMKQPEPIGINLTELSNHVKSHGAIVGLATDGDADRLGVMDENGNYITQLQVYALLALYFLEVRQERGAIVKTITTTNMLNRLGELYKVPVFETSVGFKYVAPVMQRENAMIGGEESGGYGFRGHVPERDGLLAGLYFLDLLARTNKTPSQLLHDLHNKVGHHYYDRCDFYFAPEERQRIIQRMQNAAPAVINGIVVLRKETEDGFRFMLTDGSWLLIRFSGTEPLLRIYAEGHNSQQVRSLLDAGMQLSGVKEH
ncbi:MAG: phosphoglucomutase/phosphomannomutase family protein [Dehalococcoidia bacterium]|nr:phosphoglucomutase/phosphomannomutase family protein [Dehalococcoidia bacterium]